jgi:site-specific DNA-cytosine methylase
MAFHINQREETIDLGDTAGALMATQSMQMQTFVAAGFCAGAGASAGSVGYQNEVAPTLKASPSGNMAPSVLCLNDQGGQVMEWSENVSGALRAQEHGHQPLVASGIATNPAWGYCPEIVGALVSSDSKGINNQYVGQGKCVTDSTMLIRRLTPTECERLQGYPDGWTDLPGASDSARYKALGNSVAIPCVDQLLHGIALVLQAE